MRGFEAPSRYPTTKKTEIALYGLPERNFFTESKAYTMNIARPQSFRLDKITAARRQLGTAIELLFENRDVVSICVLMHGAWSIVKDLMKHRELESSRDWMPEHFPNMSETEVWKKLTSVWSFSKHAKKDPDSVLELQVDHVERALFLAVHDFQQISISSDNIDTFQLWFVAKNKDLFESYEPFQHASEFFPDLSAMNPIEQRKAGLLALTRISNA